MELKDYKYRAKFTSEATVSLGELERYDISVASLSNLESLLPNNIDVGRGSDLLGTVFNIALANVFNGNDDGIDSRSAVQVKDFFVHKPANVEHDRSQIVGHTVSSGLSTIDDNLPLSDEDAIAMIDPFNISLGAVVYKEATNQLANLLEAAAEEGGELLTIISTSWEIAFNKFAVAAGSKYLKDCQVYEGAEAKEFKEYLRAYGGSGYLPDGRRCYRLVQGEIIPTGIGFTTKPAAEVKGIHIKRDKQNPMPILQKNILAAAKNKSSQNETLPVIENKDIIEMNIDDLLKRLDAALTDKENSESQKAVASISKLINEEIVKQSATWQSSVEKAESEKKALETSCAELKTQLEELTQKFDASQSELAQLQQREHAAKAEASFNGRMEALSEQYDFSQAERAVIASEVKALDLTEEAFASYKEKISQVWSHRDKEFIKAEAEKREAEIEEEVSRRLAERAQAYHNEEKMKAKDAKEEKDAKSSKSEEKMKAKEEKMKSKEEEEKAEAAKEVAEAALNNAEVELEQVPNNNGASSDEKESEKYANAFPEGSIVIS